MILVTIAQILHLLINVIVTIVIVQFVLGLLIAFNVVNMSNQFVAAIWTALNALLNPMLQPIRRILPNTGAVDFSPLVLIIGLQILLIIVNNLAVAAI
ncbi:MAG: YggT family protein [Novosphingobium sp.]|nr:YggT family protein [Novosphingobium sp.]MCP5379670.1 YggT family protein [Novosphingobium sp.]